MTLEEWIVAFIVHLEETGIMMDDFVNGTDSMSGITGTYSTTLNSVPTAKWIKSEQLVELGIRTPNFDNTIVGVRSGVKI